MIYVVFYVALIAAGLLISYLKRYSPLTTVLLLASVVFAPHAIASLVYAIPGAVNPDVVYQSVPLLRHAHQIIGGLIVLYLFAVVARLTIKGTVHPSAFVMCTALPMAFLLAALAFNPKEGGIDQDMLSFFAFYLCIYAFFVLLAEKDSIVRLRDAYSAFLLIALASLVVSVLELILLKVRAATAYEYLEPTHRLYVAFRSSGLFNNPNWQGLWMSLFILGTTWLFIRGQLPRWLALTGILLAGVCLYLSGSRGSAFTVGACLCVLAIFVLRRRFSSYVMSVGTLAAAFVVPIVIVQMMERWLPLFWLTEHLKGLNFRWIGSTVDLLDVWWATIRQGAKSGGFQLPDEVLLASPTAQSVVGRLSGEGADNGFLAIYYSFGILGLLSIVFPIAFAGYCHLLLSTRGREGWDRIAAAAVILTFALLLSMQLRAFSVFPIWIFQALLIAGLSALASRRQVEANK